MQRIKKLGLLSVLLIGAASHSSACPGQGAADDDIVRAPVAEVRTTTSHKDDDRAAAPIPMMRRPER